MTRAWWRMLRALFKWRLREIFDAVIQTAIRNIDGPIGESLRVEYYRKLFKSIGENVRIDTNVYIYGANYISIGNNVYLDKGVILLACEPDLDLSFRDLKEIPLPTAGIERGELVIGDHIHIAQNCMIFAYGGVKLGNYCHLSTGTKLYSLNGLPWSPYDRSERGVSILPYSGRSPCIIGPVVLGENVWLGLNCAVFPGVIIERDCFARSNSIIASSIPENSYISGDPGKRVDARYK
jgi:acetyltransferase-like isoleucine patch superfamily enzyme